MPNSRHRPRSHPPAWLTVGALAYTGLCASYMFTLVLPIQAQLPRLVDAERGATVWIVTITLLVAACITPIAGRLGDMYGKRRVVLYLIGVVMAGSLIAALVEGLTGIIVGRGLQGAMMGVIPLGIAILRDSLPPERLSTAVALMSATMGVGGALGMPLSALIVAHLDWRFLFWLAFLMSAIAAALVLLFVPRVVVSNQNRFDVLGAIGLVAGLAGILLALSRGNDWGWLSAPTLVAGFGGIAILLLWGRYQLRTHAPLLDLRVAARPAVLLTNLAAIGIGFALFGTLVTFPQLLELPVGFGAGLGVSVLGAALVAMVPGLVMLAISPLSGRLERWLGGRATLAVGAGAVVAAYAFVLVWSSEIWQLVVANVMVGIGVGFAFAAMPMLIMGSVPVHETGASNGLNALFRSLGHAISSATMGAVLAGMAVDFAGEAIPTPSAFDVCFWLGGAAALAACVLSLFIPRHPPVERLADSEREM